MPPRFRRYALVLILVLAAEAASLVVRAPAQPQPGLPAVEVVMTVGGKDDPAEGERLLAQIRALVEGSWAGLGGRPVPVQVGAVTARPRSIVSLSSATIEHQYRLTVTH